jgi:predicted dehydrogenase
MRVAVVGCGAVTEFFHVPALDRLVRRDAVWFVDPDIERARRLATRGRALAHHDDLPDVDAAIVAVPNDLHAPVAIDLLRRGIRVLVEKPLARTAPEARAIVDAAPSGDALAVGLFRRYLRATRELAGEIERPLRFVAEEGIPYSWTSASGYVLDLERSGGGVTIDLAPHVLDQLRVWFGDLEVVAYRDDSHGGPETDAVVELRAGDVTGTLELSRTRNLGSRVRVECERKVITSPPQDDYASALEGQLRDFLAGRPTADGMDGLRLAELVDECYARRESLDEPWTTETLARA